MNASNETDKLFAALSAAQGEFTTVEKGRDNPFFKSKYAPLDSIIEMVRPVLPKHGLAFVQFNDIPENGQGVIIETIITHSSGQFIGGKLLMPLAKVDPQGAGSAITYGRRYALAAALGIVSDEDVDGNGHDAKKPEQKAPPKVATINAEQNKRLRTLLTTNKVDADVWKKHFGIVSSLDLPASKMDDAVKWIEANKAKGEENA